MAPVYLMNKVCLLDSSIYSYPVLAMYINNFLSWKEDWCDILAGYCQEVLVLRELCGCYFAGNILKRLLHENYCICLEFVGNEFCGFILITNLLVGQVRLKSK